MRNSEYRANVELKETPRRRINRDYAPVVIPLGDVLTMVGALTAGAAVIVFSEEVWNLLKSGWGVVTSAVL